MGKSFGFGLDRSRMGRFGERSLPFPSFVLLAAALPVSSPLRLAQELGHQGSCQLGCTVTCLSVRIPLDLLCCFYWICFLKLPPLPLLHQQHSAVLHFQETASSPCWGIKNLS